MTVKYIGGTYPSLFPPFYPSKGTPVYSRTKVPAQQIREHSTTVEFTAPDAGQDAIPAGTVLEVRNVTDEVTTFSLIDGSSDGWPLEDTEFAVPPHGETRVLMPRLYVQGQGTPHAGRILVDYANPAAVVRAATRV